MELPKKLTVKGWILIIFYGFLAVIIFSQCMAISVLKDSARELYDENQNYKSQLDTIEQDYENQFNALEWEAEKANQEVEKLKQQMEAAGINLETLDETETEPAGLTKEEFKEQAETVSYEDLRRYPDTYRDKPIKLTLYVKQADPDGIIFQGGIIATIPGTDSEMAVYDNRKVREPRIMEGDTITVYAVGNGLATMKLQDKSGWIAKTVEKYEVPSIKIQYMD